MDSCPYSFVLEIRTKEGDLLGQTAVDPDLKPLAECARLSGLRRGTISKELYDLPVSFAPVWNSKFGQPYIRAIQATVEGASTSNDDAAAPLSFFRRHARSLSSKLVEGGMLADGDEFIFLVCAFPLEKAPKNEEDQDSSSLAVQSAYAGLPVVDRPIAAMRDAVVREVDVDSGEMPVFVPHLVLEEIEELTRGSSDRETGGVLVGHLARDGRTGELYLEITAQVPALRAKGSSTKLSFTAECWKDVRAAVTLRSRGEIFAGWWHSHPVLSWKCKECPPEKQRTCALVQGFMSEDDIAVHRTVFPRAYSVAMVASLSPLEEVNMSLFGWDSGMLVKRGFTVTDPQCEAIEL